MSLRLFCLRNDSRSIAQHCFERHPCRSHGVTALCGIEFFGEIAAISPLRNTITARVYEPLSFWRTWGKETRILRIVAGEFRGRRIRTPDGMSTRPTAQFVREALFNILAADVGGAVFIDLFAGSGAVGIEALSRGARKVLFADGSRDCSRLIRENLSELGVNGDVALALDVDMSSGGAARALSSGMRRLGAERADIIYADPPYKYPDIDGLPRFIARSGLCADGGLFILEHSGRRQAHVDAGTTGQERGKMDQASADIDIRLTGRGVKDPTTADESGTGAAEVTKIDERRYGDSGLSFYRIRIGVTW